MNNFDEENFNCRMEHALNFDEQNCDKFKSIVHYIKETLRERKVSREDFDESPLVCQIHQTFPSSTICTNYSYMVRNVLSI